MTNRIKFFMVRIILLILISGLSNIALCQTSNPFSVECSQSIGQTDETCKCILKPIPIDLLPKNNRDGRMKDIQENDAIKVPQKTEVTLSRKTSKTKEPSSLKVVTIETSDYGQLEMLLSENEADLANTIIISGPIDESDFKAIWRCAIKGNLEVLDLGCAKVRDNTIPDYALYDPSQFETGHWLDIRKIILPDEIVKIGSVAFPFMRLEQINIPSSLKELGSTVFAYDYWLDCPIVIPEGVEKIKFQTFINCCSLSESPVLPSSLKEIGEHAFANTFFQEIEFPDGLETIKEGAFQSCGLVQVKLPNSIVNIGNMAFQLSEKIQYISFPENIEKIPMGLFSYCNGLEKVVIPLGCKVVENSAFMWCVKLKDVTLPNTIETIERDAFDGCSLETVVLPQSIKTLEAKSFSIKNLKAVYCQPENPPVCLKEAESGVGPFEKTWISEATLYVPVGTKEQYMNADGWNLFQDIKETDNFPSTGLTDIQNDYANNGIVYDLMGRRVIKPVHNKIYIKNGKKFIYI